MTLNGTNIIRVDSEGYKPVEIDLSDLKIREEETNTTAALIRGVAAAFAQRGYKLSGFDAKVKSTVLPGAGLSSSAAFEVLIGRILNGLFADNAEAIIRDEIGQVFAKVLECAGVYKCTAEGRNHLKKFLTEVQNG